MKQLTAFTTLKALLSCWRAALASCVPLMSGMLVITILDDGFTVGGVAWEVAKALLAWGTVSLTWAAAAYLLLRRRARGLGLVPAGDVLGDRQTYVLRAVPCADGWQDRVRDQLAATERMFLVAEQGRQAIPEAITFRRRLGRRDHSVWGSLTFAPATSGPCTVVLDVGDGEDNLGVAGLRKGAPFVVVCELARELGLVAVDGDAVARKLVTLEPS